MSEKQVTLITLAILAIVLVAGGVGIWFLQFNMLTQENEELAKLEAKLKDAQEKQRDLPKLKEKVAKLQSEEAEKILRIPNYDKTEYDDLIDTIEDMRRRSNIFIASADYVQEKGARKTKGAAPAANKDIHKVQYEFSCGGGFFPLLRFLNLLETQQRFIRVEKCSITTARGSEGGGLASIWRDMKVKVSTFTFKIPPEAPQAIEISDEKPVPSTPLP